MPTHARAPTVRSARRAAPSGGGEPTVRRTASALRTRIRSARRGDSDTAPHRTTPVRMTGCER
jgi:hypothetical protein